MKRKARILGTCAVLALAPAMAAAQDWGGLYGGLTTGYVSLDASHTFSNGAPSGSSDPDGALVGTFVGYGIQSGNTVYGVEADLEWADASGSFVNLAGATSAASAELNWQGSVRGVLGYAGTMFSRPTLFYGTVGYAYGDFDFRGGPAAAPTNAFSDGVDGWTVGFGFDRRFSANMSLRAEYRYTDYGTASGTLAPAFPAVVMPVSLNEHAVRVGLRLDF